MNTHTHGALSHPVKFFFHEFQQHVDSIHVDPHVLDGALLHLGHQQYIQTGQRQVTQQVNSMAGKKRGIGKRVSH